MGYRAAIAWIAENDDQDLGCEDTGYIVTISMIAHLFGKEEKQVAQSVINYRKRNS